LNKAKILAANHFDTIETWLGPAIHGTIKLKNTNCAKLRVPVGVKSEQSWTKLGVFGHTLRSPLTADTVV
jgi:hypothetical protein